MNRSGLLVTAFVMAAAGTDVPANDSRLLSIVSRQVVLAKDDVQLHFPFLHEAQDGTWCMTYREGPHGSKQETVCCIMSPNRGMSWQPWPRLQPEPKLRLFRRRLSDGTWTKTAGHVAVSDNGASPLEVYEKEVAPGDITLGGNRAGGADGARSSYIVIVRAIVAKIGDSADSTTSLRSVRKSAQSPFSASPHFVVGPLAPDEWVNEGDTDGDGLTDAFELAQGLDPDSIDSDGDGFVDEGEIVETGAGEPGVDGGVIDLWDIQEGLVEEGAGGGGGGGGCFIGAAK